MYRAASVLGALPPRVRRAVGLIVLAVAVIGATSIYFLRPWQPAQPATATSQVKRPPVLRGGDFARYQFMNLSLGWAVQITPGSGSSGPYSVFRTVDGAKHWQRVLSGETTQIGTTSESLHFVDAQNGFVVAGDPLAVYRSSDGGAHWARRELPMRDALMARFSDRSFGWLVAGPTGVPKARLRLYGTADGGSTWKQLPDPPLDFEFTTEFRRPSEGWGGAAARDRAYVYLSTDAGVKWQRRDLPVTGDLPEVGFLTMVRLLPGNGVVAYVLAEAQGPLHAYTSFDAGTTWSRVSWPESPGDGGSFFFEDATHWWMFQQHGRAAHRQASRRVACHRLRPRPSLPAPDPERESREAPEVRARGRQVRGRAEGCARHVLPPRHRGEDPHATLRHHPAACRQEQLRRREDAARGHLGAFGAEAAGDRFHPARAAGRGHDRGPGLLSPLRRRRGAGTHRARQHPAPASRPAGANLRQGRARGARR